MHPWVIGRRGPGAYSGAGGGTVDTGGGFDNPPTVTTIDDTITINGKVKPGSYGKFVYPIEALQAPYVYDINVVADFSRLSQQGKLAMVAFGFKNNNDFHLVGLKGNSSGGTDIYQVHGTPPNGWNKTTGFTTVNSGATAHGTQSACDIELDINSAGTQYAFRTSGDSQATWTDELGGQSMTPFADITTVVQFGIALWFDAFDTGPFSITITWRSASSRGPYFAPGYFGQSYFGKYA